MIRGDFDPNIHLSSKPLGVTEESECKRSLRYLEAAGSTFHYASLGCKQANKIVHLKPEYLGPLDALATPIGHMMGSLARISQMAGFIISTGALCNEDELGLNLFTVKETLLIAGEGVELAEWFAEVQKLSETFKIVTALPSVGLAIALLTPMVSLLIHLREEGLHAFGSMECFKTSYKLGMALLGIYLFLTAATLSMHMQIAIMGTNAAVSLL